MIDLEIGPESRARLEMLGALGKQAFRPLGIEADRLGRAVPADHPFFVRMVELGLMRAPSREERAATADKPKTASRTAVLFAEEASYWDRGVAVTLPGPGLGGPPVQKLGTPEQQERFFKIFSDKSKPHWGAFAMTEPGAGSDVARIQTTARKDGDAWILNGAKTFISNVRRADWCVVFATIDRALGRAGHRAFVVERGTPGFEVTRDEKKMGLKAYESCSLVLNDCRVPAENLLGGEERYATEEGFKGAMSSFNASRAIVAVMAIGVARAALDTAREFLKQHYDLARPIPRTRRMLERLADAKRRLDAGRLLAWRGAWLFDHGRPNALEASMAKAYCPPAALAACSIAVELLGDAGVVHSELVEKFYRDVKAMDIVEGTQQIQRTVIARRLVGLPRESS